ncbi:MAG: hypothetical protein VB954_16225 [Thalassolituus sp.]|uniref:hypothetical protein n=1 Tax=Thalassolituus sp. TaxID=2030822 RepID=UPI0039825359
MKSISRFTLLALAAALVTSCSGNSSSTKGGTVDDNTFLTGYVGASDISLSKVHAVPLDYEGQPDTEVDANGNVSFKGQVTTSSLTTGFYQVNLATSYVGAPLILIAENKDGRTTYKCELVDGCGAVAYKGDVPLDTDYQIRAAVGESLEAMRVNINWITDLASSLATTVYIDANGDNATDTEKTGFYSEYSIEIANLHVSEMFGISDIISATPISPASLAFETTLASSMLEEGIMYGAYVAAVQKLAVDRDIDYYAVVNLVLEEFLLNQGQIFQKNTASSEVSLYELTEAAADILDANIAYLESVNTIVPAEADRASTLLRNRAASFIDGELTAVQIDVPESLASWQTSLEKSKTFITDLNKRFLNFKGDNPNEVSFIDGGYADSLELYYDGYTNVYNAISPQLDAVLQDVRDGISYYLDCLNSSTTCASSTTTNGRSLVYSASDKTVSISGTLTLSYDALDTGSIVENSITTYLAFDVYTEGFLALNATATTDATNVTFDTSTNSIDVEERPHFRLIYNSHYEVPPAFSTDEAGGIDVAWPSVKLNVAINDEPHEVEVLFETSLFGVSDPYDSAVEVHYNPTAVVFWLRSSGEDLGEISNSTGGTSTLQNYTSLIMEASTVNGNVYYADSKWPEFSNLFIKRPESALVTNVSDLATFYRSTEQVTTDTGATDSTSDDTVETAEYIDIAIAGGSIGRYRIFPYNASLDASNLQICTMSDTADITAREELACGSITRVGGITNLDDFLQLQFEGGVLDYHEVAAQGGYKITLPTDADGLLIPFAEDVEVAFDGVLENTYQLGIGALYLTATANYVTDVENRELTPTILDTSLIRKVKDYFEVTTVFGYDYDYILSNIPTGANAQSFNISYLVEYSETSNVNIEVGSLVVLRSGVTLFGAAESIGLLSTSRVEYSVGDTNNACGAYNRDELVSGDDCEAVAYLRYRGSLMATIREERPGVYIVRYVDGTWIMLGES